MALKDNLKRLRERAGYENGKELADAIGIAYPRYMTYERGSWPNEETLTKIATQLHTSIDELLGYQPPSPDDFEECKAFIESARFGEEHYRVSVESDDNIAILKGLPEDSFIHICSFESKTVFVHFVQKLKHAFPDTDDYKATLTMFINEYLDKLIPLTTMGYKVDKSLSSIPLHEFTSTIEHLQRETFLRIRNTIKNPKYENTFKKNPEIKRALVDSLQLFTALVKSSRGEVPPLTPILGYEPFPTGKEPDKADSPRADQAKEKAADQKANGDKKD